MSEEFYNLIMNIFKIEEKETPNNNTIDIHFCRGSGNCRDCLNYYQMGLKERKLPWRTDIPARNGDYLLQFNDGHYEVGEINKEKFLDTHDVKRWIYLGEQ